MMFLSIRWRLQLWHGAVLALLIAGFGVTAYSLAAGIRWRAVDDALSAQAAQLAVAVPPSGVRNSTPFTESIVSSGCYFAVWQPDGSPRLISPNAPADLARPSLGAGGGDERKERLHGDQRELYSFTRSGRCMLVGRNVAPVIAELHRLAGYFTAAGAGVLAIGLVGGWWTAARALRPIETISAAAERIAAGNLSQRVPGDDSGDELSRLAGVLNSTFSRLDAAFAQQSRFTADAAHELRTPVTAVLMHAQNGLGAEPLSDEQREAFAACQRAAQRMRRLIDSLMELARIDGGQEQMEHTPFDLADIAGDCIDLVLTLADARGIEFKTDLRTAPCAGDAGRIGQVVLNLLTNAIDYNRKGGNVTVSTRDESGAVALVVTNTGVGISVEDLPHIFDRFYRSDRSRQSGQHHNGLGLAISKAIVDTHGGALHAFSTPDEGATFTMNLPRRTENDLPKNSPSP